MHHLIYQINRYKVKLLVSVCYWHELSFGNTDEKKDLSRPGEFCAFPDPYLALAETFSCLRSDDWWEKLKYRQNIIHTQSHHDNYNSSGVKHIWEVLLSKIITYAPYSRLDIYALNDVFIVFF